MPLAAFRVTVSAGSVPRIEVNGKPLPEGFTVTGFGLATDPTAAPVLNLAVVGEGEFEGEGIVVVHRQSEGDEVEYLRQFVANLDENELERLALEGAVLNQRTGAGIKAALMRMVGE